MTTLEGHAPYNEEDADYYSKRRWWAGLNLGGLLDKAADIYPDKEALVDSQCRLTYAQVRDKANRLAVSLMDLGIQPLERVLLQVPNWHEYVVSYFALQKIGAIPIILIARYRQYEINHLAAMSEATTWIVPDFFRKTDYLPIISDVLEENPTLKRIILVRSREHKQYLSFEKLISSAELNDRSLMALEKRRPEATQVAHMGPTGGTTGLPKIVPHTHNALLCKIEYSARACEMGNETICLIVAPAAHDLPFVNGICATIFAYGKLVMMNRTEAESICQVIEKEKINTAVWVPTLTSRLIEADCRHRYDLSSLKKIHSGGGPSSRRLILDTIKELGCAYLSGYGGTEGMLTLSRIGTDIDTLCSTVGKPTCPYDTFQVVDPQGNVLPCDTEGHLVVKGPSIFTGYYNLAEENKRNFTKDGFFRTGDLAKIDARGYISITGRLKSIIKRGGESISASEIENLMSDHPAIASVGVVGMPDPVMGERVCAYVVLKNGEELRFEQIISWLKNEKGASVLQLPERIEFVSEMPLTATGKLDKKGLLEDIKEKITRETHAV